ncbi:MAG TPA: methylenetetrahydrofolate--tRNA-(uracil(54)-C(5))-methyltransferase (FADH(2)-oxidizing) TrmFO [Dissulfurispiraceae bacterium]|nr:methylenetetrahydrofolate--tRNA-(uracil(54)-C(5))-methyltransferase (FADH(2)-oxidizing) TrmFO [Dissulfurispiraceae bacterium]
MEIVNVIGGGLAGCEAAWQAARMAVRVRLYEMRPVKMTDAHKTSGLAELVCSNSLRSRELSTGPGLLKKELEIAGSLIMKAAIDSRVAAGTALAVDRAQFSMLISQSIERHPLIETVREEVVSIPSEGATIIATGPLTSGGIADAMKVVIGDDDLHFYDAIAPIVSAESLNNSKVYLASRYGKGGEDYVNCPLSMSEYDRFFEALLQADSFAAREFEDIKVFEGCMPVEVMARRGRDTLRFGPLKPVGLPDPRTGRIPYAVVQLRPENKARTAFNMVGFQTRLKQQDQKSVFRLIPGLDQAEFFRFGSIHRNTYLNSPRHLNIDLAVKEFSADGICRRRVYCAGQITGVEGYIESAAIGLLAGISAAMSVKGQNFPPPPRASAHGSLLAHLIDSDPKNFVPSNINFGLLPVDDTLTRLRDKRLRRQEMAAKAVEQWSEYIDMLKKEYALK